MSARGQRPTSLTLALALASAMALLATACGTSRTDLGTSASSCYQSLPAATATLHHRGQLLGVRRVQTAHLARRVPEFRGVREPELCVFAFRGSFPGGRFALVGVAPKPRPHTVVQKVTDRLPPHVRFRHL